MKFVIEVTQKEPEWFEAVMRSDTLIDGDNGRWVEIGGWGTTEEDARSHMKAALDEFQKNIPNLR